ncbi:hypothetical protein UFOVP33_78 [uncultured Caudovirales phage]|uniref:DUF7936 domain-containing protein n=1 Tax=uncultured Caudovirales phage TaxID=2100421 RepID=A0A6J5KRS1_9CAUD|nr:hypothetical protein UFOVP33_78 [uncultured Caudovirales phage]
MTTYTWQFPVLDVYPTHQGFTDAVFNMHWRLLCDDGNGHTADAYGTQMAGPIDPNDFIAFADLTLAEVTAWLEAAMGEYDVNVLKASLAQQIADQINPPTVSLPPPWV